MVGVDLAPILRDLIPRAIEAHWLQADVRSAKDYVEAREILFGRGNECPFTPAAIFVAHIDGIPALEQTDLYEIAQMVICEPRFSGVEIMAACWGCSFREIYAEAEGLGATVFEIPATLPMLERELEDLVGRLASEQDTLDDGMVVRRRTAAACAAGPSNVASKRGLRGGPVWAGAPMPDRRRRRELR